MQCDPIKDLILTDYLDDCLTESDRLTLENHLVSCSDCRDLAAKARQTLLMPFGQCERHDPPEAIWQAISDRITSEDATSAPFLTVIRGFAQRFTLPKPAMALAATLILLLAAGLYTRQHTPQQDFATLDLEKQVNYLAYLVEGNATLTDNGDNGNDNTEEFATIIEEYFL